MDASEAIERLGIAAIEDYAEVDNANDEAAEAAIREAFAVRDRARQELVALEPALEHVRGKEANIQQELQRLSREGKDTRQVEGIGEEAGRHRVNLIWRIQMLRRIIDGEGE